MKIEKQRGKLIHIDCPREFGGAVMGIIGRWGIIEDGYDSNGKFTCLRCKQEVDDPFWKVYLMFYGKTEYTW